MFVAIVALPFALQRAVVGIALTAIYSANGLIGQPLVALTGLKVAYTPLGILIALIFAGLPFVVRTVQPVLEDLEVEFEEAAASLGASRWQRICRGVFPQILPAILNAFSLAFAPAVAVYGSVV